jgi:c-di-GMP-binding flagellar brake protein YcgR
MIVEPSVNQHIGVVVDGCMELLSSRIEEIGEGWIAIAPPSDRGAEVPLEPGAPISFQWVTPRGLGVAYGFVRGDAELDVPAIVVDLDGDSELVQRRRHVRADAFVRIVITPAVRENRKQAAIGTTLDLAGGGIRARVPGWLKAGDLVKVRICLDEDEAVGAVARVVRRVDDNTVAFEFEDIEVNERERLVRDVFRRLRKALAVRCH